MFRAHFLNEQTVRTAEAVPALVVAGYDLTLREQCPFHRAHPAAPADKANGHTYRHCYSTSPRAAEPPLALAVDLPMHVSPQQID